MKKSIALDKIHKILNEKNLSENKLAQLVDYHSGSLNKMITGKKPFPEKLIEKLLPILEVSKEEFTAWIIADKYSKEAIQTAINELKNKSGDKLSVLTKNIDKILSDKNLSRTELSKIIKYDQSALNKMIAGQLSMSKTVISKLAPVLEVSEDTLQGWVLSGKYDVVVLEIANDLTGS